MIGKMKGQRYMHMRADEGRTEREGVRGKEGKN